jgi:N-acetyl-gamma-glutamyl-phosphate reductase
MFPPQSRHRKEKLHYKDMVKAKVVGATGYGGCGVIELLLRHPQAKLISLTAKSEHSRPIHDIFPHLRGFCDLMVQASGQEEEEESLDVVFLATPDGVGMYEARRYLERGIRVIDFSGDFRFHDATLHRAWYGMEHGSPDLLEKAVYGLPELHRSEIALAHLVANPGCFAAAALLGWAPAVAEGLVIPSSLICDAKSGVSGAGKRPVPLHHFPARNENLNAYKIVGHRHTGEIETQLSKLAGEEVRVTFTPQVGPWTRGILCTLYGTLSREVTEKEARDLYTDYYRAHPFVRINQDGNCFGLLGVRGTNFCDITVCVDKRAGRLVVVSCLDNLMKGQAGNALQNMNLMFGLEEDMGLWDFARYP